MDLSFSCQAFHGEPEASLGGEPLRTSAVERGSEADGGYQGQKTQFLCLAVLREGGSLVWQGEVIQTEPDKSKKKRNVEVFQTLALPVLYL